MKTKIYTFIGFAAILLVNIYGFLLVRDYLYLVQDEVFHYDQIFRFINHDFTYNTVLMTLPGYHLVIAFFSLVFSISSVLGVRLVAFLINLFSILIFYIAANRIDKNSSFVKTLQFGFFPLIFPFMPLIYNDILSIIFVLTSLYFVLRKKYILSGLASIASMLVRQNNIFFLIFINLIMYINNRVKLERLLIVQHIKQSSAFILGSLLLMVFIMVNRGVLISNTAKSYMHFNLSNLGNFYFLLFLSFFLFLPLHIINLSKIVRLISTQKKIILAVIIAYLFFMLTFKNDHPFNQATWFLRNYLLVTFTSNYLWKTLFFILATYAFLSISVTKLVKNYCYLFYPITFLYLFSYLMIEQRYYMIPFTLFILFKKSERLPVELVTILLYLISSLILVEGIAHSWFFL